jgi:hypothetical protein
VWEQVALHEEHLLAARRLTTSEDEGDEPAIGEVEEGDAFGIEVAEGKVAAVVQRADLEEPGRRAAEIDRGISLLDKRLNRVAGV